ncbi:MAG: Planctomycete cytochrome [Bryobacterales bacterium]|nr:Planctomycete cytochrome [Bryobacterales bacterium]
MRAFLLVASWLPAILAGETGASYFRDVRPILQRQCQGCHQPAVKSSGLDLTTFDALETGGKRGPAFRAGAPAESLLVKYVKGDAQPMMPLGATPLTAEQIAWIVSWIAGGAKNDTPAAAKDTISLDRPPVYLQPPVISALAFSPDGKTLAVSGYRELLLHKADGSGLISRLVGQSERLNSIAYSADGSTLVAAGGTPARFGEVQIWDPATGKLKRSVTLTADTLFGASISPDGKEIAVGGADNSVRLLDASSGKELQKIGNHENWVLGTVFGVDGRRVVSVGRDQAAKLSDAGSGAFLENVNLLRGELAAVARHPKKNVVVIGGEDRVPYVYLMDRPKVMKIADDTTLVRKLPRQDGLIAALAWSPNGKMIAVGGMGPQVNVYDSDSGTLSVSCKGHEAGIYAIAFSPASDRLATGGFDGHVRIYNAATGELVKDFVPVPLSAAVTTRE